MVELTAAHWIYAFFIVLVLVTMALRRETPLICIIASFILSLGHHRKPGEGGSGRLQLHHRVPLTNSLEWS